MKKLVNGVIVEMTIPEIAKFEEDRSVMSSAPAPVPFSISKRQMLLALTQMELITGEEALEAARTGAVPTAIQTVFDTLEPLDKLSAEITWASMVQVDRNHPLVSALAASTEMTNKEIDDFFRMASLL